MRYRKGAEMGINVIVITVIVLLIAAILIFIVSGRLRSAREGTSCSAYGGECKPSCGEGEQPVALECSEGGICCKAGESFFPSPN